MVEDQNVAVNPKEDLSSNQNANTKGIIVSAFLGIFAGLAVIVVILSVLNYFAIINLSHLFPSIQYLSYQNGKAQLNSGQAANTSESIENCSSINRNPFINSFSSVTNSGVYAGTIIEVHRDVDKKINRLDLKSLTGDQNYWFDVTEARKNTYIKAANVKTSSDNITVGQSVVIDFTCPKPNAIAQLERIGIQ